MADGEVLAAVQRLSSKVPGAKALKQRLHNNVTACSLVYRFSHRRATQTFMLFMYHRIFERPDSFYFGVPLEIFEAQLRFFRRACAVLSLDDILARVQDGKPLPPRCVALTCDDGYREVLTLALPRLRRLRLPMTLYVTTEVCERGWLWPDLVRHAIRTTREARVTLDALPDEPRTFALASEADKLKTLRQLDPRLKRIPNASKWQVLAELARKLLKADVASIRIPGLMLTWDEVRELNREGVDIGSHTVTHPIMTQISEEGAEQEIRDSKRLLEQQLDHPVRHFCYPNGSAEDFSPAIERMVQEAGFVSATTTIPGVNRAGENRFALKRIDAVRPSLRSLVRVMTELEP